MLYMMTGLNLQGSGNYLVAFSREHVQIISLICSKQPRIFTQAHFHSFSCIEAEARLAFFIVQRDLSTN